MIRIHHNTTRRAAKLGLEFVVEGDAVQLVFTKSGKVVATGKNPKQMLDTLVAEYDAKSHNEDESDENVGEEEGEDESQDEAEGDVDEEATDEVADEDEGRSIVKKKYRQAYRPFRGSCGDEMTRQMALAVKVEMTVTTKSGKTRKVTRTDPMKLKCLAEANGCWRDEYEDLNLGQISMNVANRLRKLVKAGVAIKWS
jgi:hypothetical protein